MANRVALAALVWALTLVLFSGVANAKGTPTTGQISATQVSTPSGGDIDSTLLAVNLLDPVVSRADAQAVAFNLDARQVRVDTYQYDPILVTSAAGVTPPMVGYQPETHMYIDASVGSAPARPGYRFSVVAPDGGASTHIVSDCGSLAPSGRQSFEAQEQVSHPEVPVTVDVSNASQWTQCGHAGVTVTGRFVVVVYGIDAVLTTGNETVELRSGDDQSSLSPLPASGPAYVTHRRQQYLYVDDGSLSFPMDHASDLAFLDQPQVTAMSLRFTDANGQLSQGSAIDPVQAASLTVDGDLQLKGITSTGQGGVLQSTFAGQISHADVDGKPLAFAVAPASHANSMNWIGVVGMVGLVAAPAALLVPRRIRAMRAWRADAMLYAADRRFERLHFDEAEDMADQVLGMAPLHPEAHMLKARLRALRNDFEASDSHREVADRLLAQLGDVEQAVVNRIEAADEAARNDSAPRALQWLRRALQADQLARDEIRQWPALEPLMSHLESRPDEEVPFWLLP
jgi:hypothetical protein